MVRRIAGIALALLALAFGTSYPGVSVGLGFLAGWVLGLGRKQETASADSPAVALASITDAAAPAHVEEPSRPGMELAGEGPNSRREAEEKRRPTPAPTIVTRTGQNDTSSRLHNPFSDSTRNWNLQEQVALVELYASGHGPLHIANALSIDQREVVMQLIALLLDPSGDITDEHGCVRHRKSYDDDELQHLTVLYNRGSTLAGMAKLVQRTQLGIGWKLLNLHVPEVSDSLLERLRD